MPGFASVEEHDLKHEIGVGILHLGDHVHGARKILSGERVNLICWCKKEPFANVDLDDL
jgi:hypothetical protein